MDKLKCYMVSDNDKSVVVFAASAGKARYAASCSGEFDFAYSTDWMYLCVRRVREGDSEYRGHEFMDWFDPQDRLFMVKELNFACTDETDLACGSCPALEFCMRRDEWEESQDEA